MWCCPCENCLFSSSVYAVFECLSSYCWILLFVLDFFFEAGSYLIVQALNLLYSPDWSQIYNPPTSAFPSAKLQACVPMPILLLISEGSLYILDLSTLPNVWSAFIPCLWLMSSFYYQDHLQNKVLNLIANLSFFHLWMTSLEFHIKAYYLTKITKIPMFSSRKFYSLMFYEWTKCDLTHSELSWS